MTLVFSSSWRVFCSSRMGRTLKWKTLNQVFFPKMLCCFFFSRKIKKGSLWFSLKQFFSMYFTVLTVNWKVDHCCISGIFTCWFGVLYPYLVEISIKAFSLSEALKYRCVWVMNKGFQTVLWARKSWAFSGFNSVYFSLSPMCFHVGKEKAIFYHSSSSHLF